MTEARVLAEAGGLGTAEAEGSEAAEAEVLFPKEAMLCAENSAPRPPTHHGAQLGDGPHSPVGWWAARSTAGLYGARDAKSSRDEVAGYGAAWAATALPPGRNEAGPSLAQARCQDGASPNAERLRRPLHPATTPRVPVVRPP